MSLIDRIGELLHPTPAVYVRPESGTIKSVTGEQRDILIAECQRLIALDPFTLPDFLNFSRNIIHLVGGTRQYTIYEHHNIPTGEHERQDYAAVPLDLRDG